MRLPRTRGDRPRDDAGFAKRMRHDPTHVGMDLSQTWLSERGAPRVRGSEARPIRWVGRALTCTVPASHSSGSSLRRRDRHGRRLPFASGRARLRLVRVTGRWERLNATGRTRVWRAPDVVGYGVRAPAPTGERSRSPEGVSTHVRLPELSAVARERPTQGHWRKQLRGDGVPPRSQEFRRLPRRNWWQGREEVDTGRNSEDPCHPARVTRGCSVQGALRLTPFGHHVSSPTLTSTSGEAPRRSTRTATGRWTSLCRNSVPAGMVSGRPGTTRHG